MSVRKEAKTQTGVCDDRTRGRGVTNTARSPIFNVTTVMVDNLHQDVSGSAQFASKLSGMELATAYRCKQYLCVSSDTSTWAVYPQEICPNWATL